MSCSPFDLREYFLKELPDPGRRQVESHLKVCTGCREELDRLRMTEAALLTLRDEEIPQRIAFVSDKIFEPSPLRRWWSGFWASGARLGFASAAMLSAAIVVFALTRPVPAPAPVQSRAPEISAAAIESEIERRVAVAVQKAAADIEERQSKKTSELVANIQKRNEMDRQSLILATEQILDYERKRMNRYVVASSEYGPPREASGALR